MPDHDRRALRSDALPGTAQRALRQRPRRPCWWSSASTAWASATWSPNINFFSKVVVDDAGAMHLAAGHCAAGQHVDLRFEMDTLVLLHAGPHPLATAAHYAPAAVSLQAYRARRRPRARRRLPHALPGECARLRQHRTPTVDAGARPERRAARIIDAGRARRRAVDGRGAARPAIPHRRPRGQPGRRHAVLQRRDTAEHYSAQNTIQAQRRIYLTTGTRAVVEPRAADADASSRTPAAGTTRWAAPARPRATPCVTRSRSVTCTAAATASCWRWRDSRVGGMTKRDLPSNINFFMNVPVTPDGRAALRRWHLGAPAATSELRARDGRAGADLQLPAAQQPLQRLQSDADSIVMTWDTRERAFLPAGRPAAQFRRTTWRSHRGYCAMFRKILIANRGAIALPHPAHRCEAWGSARSPCTPTPTRTRRTCAMPTRPCASGPAPAAESYLRPERILEVARAAGAEAIHPGYGFLSENADFARGVRAARLALHRARRPAQMRDFGLKHTRASWRGSAACRCCRAPDLLAIADARAGGGGAHRLPGDAEEHRAAAAASACAAAPSAAELRDGLRGGAAAGRRQLQATPACSSKKFVARARHIEVQLFGDGAARCIALGERDCSVQRRNQKVIEETPAPGLTARRARGAARRGGAPRQRGELPLGRHGRVRATTPTRGSFYFLEVNTRLQVEHGVTEEVGRHRPRRVDDPHRGRRRRRICARIGTAPQRPRRSRRACTPRTRRATSGPRAAC